MTMLPQLAAAVANHDPLISGNWLIYIVSAIAAGIALVIGKFQGRREAETRMVTINNPVPLIRTKTDEEFVTMDAFNSHLRRFEKNFHEIKAALDAERGIARTANGNIHQRIDALSERFGERLSNLEGGVEGIAATTGRLLDMALHNKRDS